ncbi:MAG: DUF86 domain-containing protein [Meiothermus sp.]|nr:DUF86 domain-containing protein [Meiothermus sp.]
MANKTRLWLEDILEAAGHIEGFLDACTLEDYLENEMLRSAVERKLEIIGEAMNRLVKRAPQVAQRIGAFRQIIAFRNLLAHEYDQISHGLVWQIVQQDLPVLRNEVRSLLEQLGDE